MAHRFGKVSQRTQVGLAAIAGLLAVATIVGVIVLRPTGEERGDLRGLGFASEVYGAEVTKVEELPCQGEVQGGVVCRFVTFTIAEGPDEGEFVSQELVVSGSTPELAAGDSVTLAYDPNAEPDFRYRYYDR